MELDYTKIGGRIRAKRKQKNFSQEQLAEAAGVGTSHISHIETGHTKASVQTLVNICNALDVSADELLCDHIHQAKAILADEAATLLASCGAKELDMLMDILWLAKTSAHIIRTRKA